VAIDPQTLILCPLVEEWRILSGAFAQWRSSEPVDDLKIDAAYFPDWRVLVAPGGHGKTQFAVQAQYLISRFPSARCVVCAGAAGGLVRELGVGDVVVATETVEHDYRLLFARRPPPRFAAHGPTLAEVRHAARAISGFRIAFDVIASGDEDVVTTERALAIRRQTGAACVAWEGSGAARAARFNGIGSLEIRAITDATEKDSPQKFAANLPIAISNLAVLLHAWLERSKPPAS
jgi:adenosylhomocysteine nucleosidase